MKSLIFTYHAPARMAQRTVREPAWTAPYPTDSQAERRYRHIPERGDRVLRVVVVETANAVRVTTVTFDRGALRRRARHHLRPGG